MDQLKDAIQFIYERGKGESQQVIIDTSATDKLTFASSSLNLKQVHADPLPPAPPLITTFKVQTLAGLVDLIKHNLEGINEGGFDFTSFLVHVVDQTTVHLVADTSDKWARRLVLAQADAFEYQQFPFGRQLAQEEFIVNFQTRFVPDDDPTSDYSYVLRIASNLTASVVATADDNGINQEIVVRSSVSGKRSEAMRPRVGLRPYRTFSEVEQPNSGFLFRTHQTGTPEKPGLPLLSITEADGGAWRKSAMDNISRFLSVSQDLPVIC